MNYLSDQDYDFIYSRVPRICIDIVIRRGNKFCLLMRAIQPYKGKYHLPGGRVRFRESISQAIKRIAKDEIGCKKIHVLKLLGFMEFIREKQSGKKRHSISIAFLCRVDCKINYIGLSNRVHPIHLKFLKSL